jgi:ubiquinone/menaquinone biosynthesis C-methylase UbiE
LKEKLYKFLQSFNLQYKKNILVDRIKKGSKVLDYGCGAGEFVKYIENDFETFGLNPIQMPEMLQSIKLKSKNY